METHLFWNTDIKSVFFSELPKGQDGTDCPDHLSCAGLDGQWQALSCGSLQAPEGMKGKMMQEGRTVGGGFFPSLDKVCSHSTCLSVLDFLLCTDFKPQKFQGYSEHLLLIPTQKFPDRCQRCKSRYHIRSVPSNFIDMVKRFNPSSTGSVVRTNLRRPSTGEGSDAIRMLVCSTVLKGMRFSFGFITHGKGKDSMKN